MRWRDTATGSGSALGAGMPDEFDAAYWEARYRGHAAHGSAGPNPHLVAEVGLMTPGTALEVGCGEGGDALWLAERGWRVTAVDISPTALRRAREHAESRDADVAGRIDWVEADLTFWEPPPGPFDLVTAHYVHPAGSRQDLLRRLAAAVAPGAVLFVVDHDQSDAHARAHSSVDELAASLEPRDWAIEVAETRARWGTDPHGGGITMCDAVLRARRRAHRGCQGRPSLLGSSGPRTQGEDHHGRPARTGLDDRRERARP